MMFVSRLALAIGSIVVMFFWNWQLTLIYLAIALLGVILTVLLRGKAKEYSQEVLFQRLQQNALLLDIIKGMRQIRSFLLSGLFVDHLDRRNDSLNRAEVKTGRIALSRDIIHSTVSDLGFGLMLTIGMLYATKGICDAATVLAFAMLVKGYSWAILSLSNITLVQADTAPSVERLYALVREEEEIIASSRNTKEELDTVNEISAYNVSYYYENNKGLAHFSFTARRNEPLIIIGETGSGKSTLIKLLLRLYSPHTGFIEVDGLDISHLSLSDWRKKISYISQECEMLPGNILSNIALGETEPDMMRAENAARMAGIFEKIQSLDSGFLTSIEAEKPLPFSGGERQRLALARVFYNNAPIVVMDEPSAMLDPAGEAALGNTIEKLAKDRICIIISHRNTHAISNSRVIRIKRG